MLPIYRYDDYRKFLREAVDERKESGSLNFSRLADAISVQRSYLSNVLNGRGNLNSDQLFLLGEQLYLSRDQSDFLLLLLEIERCQIPARKALLEKQKEAIRKKHHRTEQALNRAKIVTPDEGFAEYYSNPVCPILHMALTIGRFDPFQLKDTLNVSKEAVVHALGVLERLGLVKFEKGRYHVTSQKLHLSENSSMARLYATTFRLKAIEYQQKRDNKADYFFTSSFSATPRIREEAQEKLVALIKWLSDEVEDCKPENIYHINFDLFRI